MYLDKLDPTVRNRIKERLKNLEVNPIPADTKYIGRDNNEKVFRYRIGNVRALYKVKEADQVVLIAKIDKRERVYG